MMLAALKSANATPLAVVVLLAAFGLVVGVWYLIANRRKIRRWWRKMTARKDFWGYVLAGVLFFGFSGFFIFLGFRY